MFSYEIWQWIVFFFIYCFLGWIWETTYVSIKNGKFVNRGFLNGPFLPIYGSGAIAVLFVVIPVRNDWILVFLLGMIAATALELVTGICMENIFHVKYWDYSYRKIQYKGYVCLVSSLAWGVFSCAMIFGFHRPIEKLVLSIPNTSGQLIAYILTIVNVFDFATSFKTALELKNMLITSEDIRKQIDRLERRAEIVQVFMADSAGKASEEFKEYVSDILEKISASKEGAQEEFTKIMAEKDEKTSDLKHKFTENKSISDLLRRNPDSSSEKHLTSFGYYKSQFIDSVNSVKNKIKK